MDSYPGATGDLRRALVQRLPGHMIPAIFVPLAELPLTAGGKVNRNALLRHDLATSDGRALVEPRTQIEVRLAEIWRQVLRVEQVGIHDEFFELGGDSLLALRLAALVHRQLGKELPLSSLLVATDIAGQARLLESSDGPWSPLVCLQPEGDQASWCCVHAVAGDVLCYRELAGQMGKRRPIYALQAPEASGDTHPGSVEGLAAIYVEALRAIQPTGSLPFGRLVHGGRDRLRDG